jgi:hypothetical protein
MPAAGFEEDWFMAIPLWEIADAGMILSGQGADRN